MPAIAELVIALVTIRTVIKSKGFTTTPYTKVRGSIQASTDPPWDGNSGRIVLKTAAEGEGAHATKTGKVSSFFFP